MTSKEIYKKLEQKVSALEAELLEQKRGRAALQKSNEYLEKIIDSIADPIFIKDRQHRWMILNQAFCKFMGYPREDLIGKSDYDFFPQKEADIFWTKDELVFETGQENLNEENFTDAKGVTHIIQTKKTLYKDKAGVQSIVGIIRDVTQLKQAEVKLRRLATVVEQSTETVIITDPDRVIQYVNPAFESITGYSREEAIGQNASFLKSGEHGDEFYRQVWETLCAGEVWTGRFTNRKKDGTSYLSDAIISPIRDDSGQITSHVSVQRDITEAVRLEEMLNVAQKMEAVGQLAGGVAHDFNNLLQVIQGYTDMAIMSLSPEEQARTYLSEVMKTVHRAITLIRQLLIFSQRKVTRPEYICLDHVIADMIKLLRRVIGEHIELCVIPGQNIRSVYADPGQVEQLMMNLCVNARDAMPGGGKITIETRNIRLDETYCEYHPWAREGEFVLCSVSDTGTGISSEVMEHIFEPFFTTKRADKGTGLGLATVFSIVKQHEGIINVYSEPGLGSTFKIYFPAEKSGMEVCEPEHERKAARGGNETILLAEDDELVRNMTVQILKRAGYGVRVARDGGEAIQIFEKYADEIDLALLDIIMPRETGRTVCEKIRQSHPEMPVLFTTGYSFNALEKDVLPAEGFGIIQKPYSPSDLLCKVREMFSKTCRIRKTEGNR